MPHIKLTIDGAVASLSLDNPPQNRIGDEMINELSMAIDEIGASEARVLLVRAEGADFSFGGHAVGVSILLERSAGNKDVGIKSPPTSVARAGVQAGG